jgi:Mannosyl-glycoprotein endo-beta-N-acetylglucosaminidase
MRRILLYTTLVCVLLSLVLSTPQSSQAASFTQTPRNPYSVLGAPTISAIFINSVLATAHSPAAGKGQALYDDGVKYGIDPVFALAFFQHESAFGTTGVARYSLSLGNLRCIPNALCRDNFAWFPSWEAGFEAWYRLILYGYVGGAVTIPLVGHTCITVAQIIPVYAPSSDHNNVAAYIGAVESSVDRWRAEQGTLSYTPPPIVTPTPSTLVNPYRVLGKPTITVAFINRLLAAAHSPAAGKGQALYDDGIRYGIDPVFALAFFMYESKFGTQGIAQVTHALGTLRTPITPTCRCQAYQGVRQYQYWEDSFLDWYDLIRNWYVNQWHLTTINQIVQVYASAGGDKTVNNFIQAIKHTVAAWRKGQTPPLITEAHMFPAYTPGSENERVPLPLLHLEHADQVKRG